MCEYFNPFNPFIKVILKKDNFILKFFCLILRQLQIKVIIVVSFFG